MSVLPIAAIIATRNRADICAGLLQSLSRQDHQPAEIIFCDASDDDRTRDIVAGAARYLRATAAGAAPQRNQALAAATQPYVLLMDDDITLEPGCLANLWKVMSTHPDAGAVTATIVNEAYTPPGRWTRCLLRWMEDGRERATYAGACVGPGITFWPADDPSLPEAVPVEWMGTTCALYRRLFLPDPPFARIFHGASLGEDLALSLTVAKRAPLLQAARARFIHLNAGGDHKRNVRQMATMGLINRHYIMTRVMGKHALRDYLQFMAMLSFGLLGSFRQGRVRQGFGIFIGYLQGAWRLLTREHPC